MDRRWLIAGGIIVVFFAGWMMLSKKQSVSRPDRLSAARASSPQAKELYKQAVKMENEGHPLKAKEMYQEILTNHPDVDNIASVQKDLEKLNMNIIFSGRAVPGKTVMYDVVPGDTLGKLAKKFGTTVGLIKVSNHLKNDVIRVGDRLRIWTAKFNIVVDRSQNILILKQGNEVVKVYNVSTGANNSTPLGTYTITSKLVNPVWFNRGAVVPPESPANALGTRWMGLDLPGYGIHGTVDPKDIGKQVTAGCVRMRNSNVEQLYTIIPMGTKVTIVN